MAAVHRPWLARGRLGHASGHGDNRPPRRAEVYDGAALVADYRALIERHGAARNILVGHSYGARLTLCVLAALKAEGRLDRIERAILLGAPPPIPSLGIGPIATWPLWLLILMRPMINANFVKLAWDASADPALVRFEDQATRANSLFMMKALMTRSAPLNAADLAGLTLPVLLLAGDHDGLDAGGGRPGGGRSAARRGAAGGIAGLRPPDHAGAACASQRRDPAVRGRAGRLTEATLLRSPGECRRNRPSPLAGEGACEAGG